MFSIYADMTEAERQVAGYLTNLGLYWIISLQFFFMMKRRDQECGHLTSTFQNLEYTLRYVGQKDSIISTGREFTLTTTFQWSFCTTIRCKKSGKYSW